MASLNAADLTLHAIYDPLCGWCYAAAPLLRAATGLPGLTLRLHGGGMLSGDNRRVIDAHWRDHVLPHDRRIAQFSGQPFGPAYTDGLLKQVGLQLDSEPPIRAVLAAQQQAPAAALAMLEGLQRAYYVKGQSLSEPFVALALAESLGLDTDRFARDLAQLQDSATQQHIAQSRQLLAQSGGQGFPTLLLQRADGSRQRVDFGVFVGRVPAWVELLADQLRSASATTAAKTLASGRC